VNIIVKKNLMYSYKSGFFVEKTGESSRNTRVWC